MIKRLEIHNLKSIDNLQMDCSCLNLWIGTNSSGKSTINQGLLFTAQNMDSTVGLNGKLIELGSFAENKCHYSPQKNISVEIMNDMGYIMNRSLQLGTEETKLMIHTEYGEGDISDKAKSSQKDFFKNQFNYQNRRIQYLSCHRIGPRKLYDKNMSMEDVIGTDGEYAISYLNQHGGESITETMCKYTNNFTLLAQVNYWLHYIVDAEIRTEEILGADAVKASYSMNDISEIRPANIGSGISYLISILIMCLSSPQDSIIVIENPEIHLHPSAQAKLCEFFYFIAERGRQLFIESHSDHIFNGFRAGIATNTMKSEFLNIQYISLGDTHTTQAMKVKIGKYGRIENQREGLFDQFDIDLNKMIGL